MGSFVATPVLELQGISKKFAAVAANDSVDLTVFPGEIHALLGENGAGKSTLVKIIYGVLQADRGSIRAHGEPVTIESPKHARALGIGMVFQHFSLFDAMRVSENILLGIENIESRRGLVARIREVSAAYGLPLDPNRQVFELSVSERQRIEIVRCLLQEPKLLIMDEPTSVLTPQESQRLFETLRKLAAEGVAILYISHKLQEIQALCHKATILRQGKVVADVDPSEETPRSMAQLMVGKSFRQPEARAHQAGGDVRLRISGLNLEAGTSLGTTLKSIGFDVHRGEIFGIAGVAGNGQSELLAVLAGERMVRPEMITFDGMAIGHLLPPARRAQGICFVPEERNGHGAVASLTLAENTFLSARTRMKLTPNGFLRYGAARRFAKKIIESFDVRTGGVDAAAGSLSGGNLQKFLVGREMLQSPELLIIAQPTWGVDAAAAAAVHQALLDMASEGAAILIISQDLDELLFLTDRLAVINEGRLSRPLTTSDASIEEIGLLMGGVHGSDAPGKIADAA